MKPGSQPPKNYYLYTLLINLYPVDSFELTFRGLRPRVLLRIRPFPGGAFTHLYILTNFSLQLKSFLLPLMLLFWITLPGPDHRSVLL